MVLVVKLHLSRLICLFIYLIQNIYIRYWKGSKEKDVVEFMEKNFQPNFEYADFAPMFKTEFYDPDHWADVIASSGAK
jgi:alpha-L-fucosidase